MGGVRRRVGELLVLGVVGVCIVSVLGFCGRWWAVLDLMAHFRVQYAAVLLMVFVVLALCRWFKRAVVVGIVAGVNVAVIVPFYVPVSSTTPSGETLRLLSLNVHSSNREYASVLDVIRAEDPDVVLLLELRSHWEKELTSLGTEYPYSIVASQEDDFGIGLWSRFALRNARLEHLGNANVRSVVTEISVGDQWIRFIGTHPVPPIKGSFAAKRNAQLQTIAHEVSKRGDRPMVVTGDLNVSPWSVYFKDLLRDGGLKDSARGFGLQRTWPTWSWVMRIPIDHVLVTDEFFVKDRHVTSDVGSDHLGVVVDLVLREGGG